MSSQSSEHIQNGCCPDPRSVMKQLVSNAQRKAARATYSVDRLEECVSEDVKRHVATRLDTTVPVAIISRGKEQILLLNGELLVTNGDAEIREVLCLHAVGHDVTLVLAGVRRALDSLIQGVADLVRYERQSGAGVSDGRVSGLVDRLAVDDNRRAGKLPESLRVVDVGPRDFLARGGDQILVDPAKGVEAVLFVIPGAVES